MGSKKNEVAKSFAQWTSKPHYSVTFNAGDHGVISGSNIVDRYEGQMITIADVPVVKPNAHYILKGWTPEFTEYAVTQNETYTAVYEYVAATVHFNTGENGESVPDREIDRGSSIENLPNPRHRSGIFVGWYSDSGLQNAVDLSTWIMPTPAVETTFYAKWDMNAVKVIVSYVVNGGTAKPASVVKVLLDSEGWASTSGNFTLAEADIPIITPDATHEGDPTWSPRNPLGAVLSDAATFTATFAEKRFRVQVIGNEHVDITNGDQTVVIGSAIIPIVVKPKSGWGYGYSEANLTALSGNGLTAVYSGYDNSITISGSLSADTTLTTPTCSASEDFRFVFCDNTSCAEISGMVYNLSEDSKTTWLTVNGTTDINSSTKIYGLTAGTNIVLSVKEVPAGFNMPGSDISYGIKGHIDEVYVLYGSVGGVLPGTDPTIVEIHQNVVGSESNKLDIFKYDVNINNNTTKLYIQGTKDAKLTGTMGTHTYSIVQLDENKYGYITSIISGSLSGSINTNSGTPAILTTKYLKGEEGQGQLVIRCYLDGAYIPGRIKDESTFTPEDIKVKTGITLFGENVNVVGEHGNFNFENNFAQTIISVPGYNTGLQVKAAGANKLPSCGYGVSTEIVYPSYWPEWAKDHVRIENSRMSGQIMNTTLTDAELRMIYKTSGTWEISVEGDVVSSPSSIPSLIISLLNNDDSLWLIDAQFGDVNFTGGRVNINGRKLKTTQMMRLPAVSKRIKFSASKDSKYDYVPEFIWFESSNSGAPFPGDINDLPIVIKENSNERILIRWVKNVLPGTVAPDPNCNIADVQINGASIETGVTTFNWNQTLKLVYKNQLQTGGLNALWAAFGETEYTNLVMNLDASVNINSSGVEASWTGLEQAQYDLVNNLKDTNPYIQIYDENGLPSKFVIVNAGCTHKKTLHPELILNIDVSEVGGEGVSQNIYGVVKETPSSTPVNVIIYSQGGIGNPAYITKNLKPFESVTELSKFTVVNEVCLHTDTITAPQYGKYESDYLTGWTRFSDGETVKYIPNYLDPITAQYKSVCYRIFGIESGAKTIDVKGQRLLSGDYADPADYQADSPINRPWPDIQNSESCCMIHGDTMNFLVSSITPITYMVNSLESTLEFEIVADINNYEMYNPTRYDLERIINDRVLKDSIKLSSDKVTIKGIRVRSFTSPTLPVGNELSTKPYTIKCSIDMISNASSGTKVDLAAKNMTVFNDASRDVDSGKFMTISIIFITPPHGKY